jgi:hypothetical protein
MGVRDQAEVVMLNESRSNFARGGLPNPPLAAGFGNPAGAFLDLLSLKER